MVKNAERINDEEKKNYRELNAQHIEACINGLIEQIKASDTDFDDEPFSGEVFLYDKNGKLVQLVTNTFINVVSFPQNGILKANIEFSCNDIQTMRQEKKAKINDIVRSFYITVESNAFEVTSGTYLNNESFRDMYIGSSLLYHGERLKQAVLEKLGSEFGITTVHSVITDASTPSGWTSEIALSLGYTPAKSEHRAKFERWDELNQGSFLSKRFDELWKKRKGTLFSKIFRW